MAIEIASLISCMVCFSANTYMAAKTKADWIRTAALVTATLCLLMILLDAFLLTKG